MFEYLFPIFAFGLVVTAIVCKGLLAAADLAKAERTAEGCSSSPAVSPGDRRLVVPPAAIAVQTSPA